MSINPDRGSDVKPLSVVEEQLGPECVPVMEILLSAHATHLLDGQKAGLGIMIEGPSGGGKTTLLRSFFEFDAQIYRSDDLTPASFVSHDASRTEEELEEIDLLPKLRDKTLVVKDMASWFSGSEEQISKRWSVFADIMDGSGYNRDSGSHGRRGDEYGDIRFNFLGATTPIPPRGHRVMGSVGARLLFVELNSDESTRDTVDEVLDGTYSEKVDRCNKATRIFLGKLWDIHAGIGGVPWASNPSDEVKDHLAYLADLTRYARAPVIDGSPQREKPPRLISLLYDLARGHALLYDRKEVTTDDMAVSARAALDSMPYQRRAVIRELVNPERDNTLKTDWVSVAADVSLPTARSRMDLIDDLGIGMASNPDSTEAKTLMLHPKFEWPDELPFPC